MPPITLDGSLGITTPTYGGADTSEYLVPVTQFKNRIINGAMVIDQRNAGAIVTPTSAAYTLDRWTTGLTQASKFSVQQAALATTGITTTGFRNALLVTSLSAYSVLASDNFNLQQRIEGFNVADLCWGTSAAKTVTLSFWTASSLTGTFGGSLRNGANNRSYPFTYTISSANTWEYKTITVVGDTTGTWATDNATGLFVIFGLGAGSTVSGTAGAWAAGNFVSATGAVSVLGTNGATWYITGVQLEVGSTATSFDYRPYGTELALCQRYYYKVQASAVNSIFGAGYNSDTANARHFVPFPVSMRTAPTALETSGTAGHYRITHAGGNTNCNAVPTFNSADTFSAFVSDSVASGLTTGQGSVLGSVNSSAYLGWSAEL